MGTTTFGLHCSMTATVIHSVSVYMFLPFFYNEIIYHQDSLLPSPGITPPNKSVSFIKLVVPEVLALAIRQSSEIFYQLVAETFF